MAQQGQYAQIGQRAKHPGTLADYRRNNAADIRGYTEQQIREQWQQLLETERGKQTATEPALTKARLDREGRELEGYQADNAFDASVERDGDPEVPILISIGPNSVLRCGY